MNTFEKKKARHQAFWDMKSVDRPLMIYQMNWNLFSANFMKVNPALHSGYITPDMIDVTAYDSVYDEILDIHNSFTCDRILGLEPYAPIPWMEAITGSKVRASEQYMVSAPVIGEDDPYDILFDRGNGAAWEEKYFQIMRHLRAKYEREDVYIVCPILRGIFDVAAALVTPTRVLIDYYEDPEMVQGLLNYVTDINAAFVERHRHEITRHNGDSVIGLHHIWAPGFSMRLQEDFSALLNPRMFEETELENIRRMCGVAEYTLMHMHPTSEHLLDSMLSIPEIRAIEMNIDAGFKNEDIRDYTNMLHKMRDSGKAIVLNGLISPEDAKYVVNEIGSEGLCLQPVIFKPEEAEEYNRAIGYCL